MARPKKVMTLEEQVNWADKTGNEVAQIFNVALKKARQKLKKHGYSVNVKAEFCLLQDEEKAQENQ